MKQLLLALAFIIMMLTGCGSDSETNTTAASLMPPQPEGVAAEAMPPSPPTLQ